MGQDRPAADPLRQQVQGRERARRGIARAASAAAGGLTFSSTRWRTASRVSRNRKRVRSIVPNRLPTIGNGGPLDPSEEQGRAPGLVDPPLDGGGLQVGVDLAVDRDQLARALRRSATQSASVR